MSERKIPERGKPVTLYLMPAEIAALKAAAKARGAPMSRRSEPRTGLRPAPACSTKLNKANRC